MEDKLYSLACDYADQGMEIIWFNFYFDSESGRYRKKPGVLWRQGEATKDKNILKSWFSGKTDRKIGIKTGKGSKGVVAIDIDVNKDGDFRSADEKKKYIIDNFGPLPDTVEVHTPSGGRHLYYIANRAIKSASQIFLPDPINVDSRGDGGVIVAPDEIDYITDSESEFKIDNMASLPEWLYKYLERRDPIKGIDFCYSGEIPLDPGLGKSIHNALNVLDCSDYSTWINTGHAIKMLNSEDAKQIWIEWSASYPKFNLAQAEDKWESFQPNEITVATLFYHAKEKGYIPEHGETPYTILLKQHENKITGTSRFQLMTASDAMRERPPISWIVDGLLVEGGLCMMTGDAGSGKTWTALDMAVAIAKGHEWLGRNVIQGTVLIIDEESGDHRLATRLQKIFKGHNAGVETPLYYFTMQGADIRNALDVYEIEKIIEEKEIKFIIIDAFMDVVLGADENSVKDIMPAFSQLKQIVERTGVTFLIIHHNDKSGKGYRGSTAIKGAVDLMLEVEKEKADIIKIKTAKIRDGEPVEFKAKMNFSDYDFSIICTESAPEGPYLTKGEKFILQYLTANGTGFRSDIKNDAHGNGMGSSVNKAFSSLVSKGYIARVNFGGQGQNAEYGIVEKKKYEVQLLISEGYTIGNIEEIELQQN